VSDLSRAGHDAERVAVRRRRLIRTAVAAVILVLLVAFIVQNSQSVKVHFWFWGANPELIWVILGCLVIGGVIGYFIARPPRWARRRQKQ
jgi:uncharacterized integral membrane protein